MAMAANMLLRIGPFAAGQMAPLRSEEIKI